jgi:transcriptional regulator GlxA family with amidase domain
MQRRHLLQSSLAFAGLAAASTPFARAAVSVPNLGKPVHDRKGYTNVAIVVGPETVAIDAIGPHTTFLSSSMFVDVASGHGFNVYTVAETTKPYDAGGVALVANYAFKDAPEPHVLVVPQQKHLDSTLDYIKAKGAKADVTMSVCTGAFLVAETGLFGNGRATTHHSGYERFAQRFPQVTLVRDVRYVEDPSVSSSGGESCGIDLSLRVVERYFGLDVADKVAYSMEYRRTPRPTSAKDV